MGVGDTNTLPSRSFPAEFARRAPGLPARVPGGVGFPAPLPSRQAFALPMGGGQRGGFVPGGAQGTVTLFTPSVNKSVPFYVGNEQCNAPILRRGITWIRGRFANLAGLQQFQPGTDVTGNWTANTPSPGQMPASPIPWSRKPVNGQGGLRRQFGVDQQLFEQFPPWHIQKPLKRNVQRSQAQPSISNPYQPRLTKWFPAASFGQTTKTLTSKQAMQNLLQQLAANNGGQSGY